MFKFKKSISLLMVGTMLLSVGCAKTTEKTPTDDKTATTTASTKFNKAGTFPINKEKVPIKITIKATTQVEDFETNRETQIIEEKGNFDLTFNVLPSAEFDTKINLMVAAGGDGLGDVMMTNNFKDANVYQYAQADAIVPLTKYYKDPEASYYIQEALKLTGTNFLTQITSPDGEIYGIPRYNQALSNEYPAKMWFYKEWLNKLNLKTPTTPDEFYTVLKAIKTKDPNGNGKADEIPFVSSTADTYWFQFLMNPYVYAGDTDFFTVENGKIGLAYTTDAWKEGLKYIKKLVSEDLVSPLTLTQDSKALKTLMSSKDTIVGSTAQVGMTFSMNASDPRIVNYEGIPPLKGNNGTQYASYKEGVAFNGMLVTKQCKNVDAAFRLGDYLCSQEISIHTRWGEKGIDYLEPVAGDVSLYAKAGYKPTLKEVLVWGGLQNKLWAQIGPYVRQASISLGVVASGDPLDTAKPIAEAQMLYTDKKPKQTIPKLIYKDDESEKVTEPLKSLSSYVKESYANFITGGKDIDKDWDSYLKEIEKIGGSKVVNTAQTVYDRMYKAK